MINWIVWFLVSLSVLWVYFDASKNKIGKINEHRSFNLSAGGWAIGSMLLWIVYFPAYLIKRTEYIKTAKDNPVEATSITIKVIALSIAPIFFIFGSWG